MSRTSNKRPILVWCHACRSYFSDNEPDHRCNHKVAATKKRPFVLPPKRVEVGND